MHILAGGRPAASMSKGNKVVPEKIDDEEDSENARSKVNEKEEGVDEEKVNQARQVANAKGTDDNNKRDGLKKNDGDDSAPDKIGQGEGQAEQLGMFGKLKELFRGLFGEKNNHIVVDLDECDLDAEEIEEYRMVSQFNDREISILRVRFRGLSGGEEWISKEQLMTLTELEKNPLKHRVAECFETDGDGIIDFREFIITLSHFSSKGSREKKLMLAFKMHDYDGDDKISKQDLKKYLLDITRITLTQEQLDEAAARDAEEIKHKRTSDVQDRIDYNREVVERLKNEVKGKNDKNKSDEKTDAASANKEEQSKRLTSDSKDNGGDKVPKAELKALMLKYNERIKFLEYEGVLDRVIENTFEEASSDREYITREEFVRVIGHSDFQGKITVDFCEFVKVAKAKKEAPGASKH